MADVQGEKKSKGEKLEKNHECPLCGKKFSRQYVLEQHMMISHDGDKPHECSACGKGYTTAQGLKYHVRTHTGEKPDKCSVCNKGFATPQNLKMHMLIHTGEKPYTCPICNKSFRKYSYEHMKIHTGEKRHKCLLCGKVFTTGAKMRRHMMTHTGEKPHECLLCTRRFAQKGHLKDHMRTHSAHHTLRGCSICGQTFTLFGDLSRHMLQHMVARTQTTTHDTTENINTESDSSGLKQNRVTHEDRILYACAFCDRQFDTLTAAGMRDACSHLDTHTEDEVRPGSCTPLDAETRHLHAIDMVTCDSQEHETTQGDQVLYACCFCDKQFDTTTPEGMIEACDHLDTHKEDRVETSCAKQPDSKVGDGTGRDMVTCTPVTNTDEKSSSPPASPVSNAHSRVAAPSVKTNLASILRPVHSETYTPRFKIPHLCLVCNLQFSRDSYLQIHMLSHEESADEDGSGLEQHTSTHAEEKSYNCTNCDTDFSTKSALKEHEVTHADRIQYACSVCSRQFDTMLDACTHMHTHNKGILEPMSALQHTSQVEDDKDMVTSTAVTGVEETGRPIRGARQDNSHIKLSTFGVAAATDKEDKTTGGFGLSNETWAEAIERVPQSSSIGPEIGLQQCSALLPKAEPNEEKDMSIMMNKRIKTEHQQCSMCEQRFVNPVDLTQHMSTLHAAGTVCRTPCKVVLL